MNTYSKLLRIAEHQVARAEAGDIEGAIGLLDLRQRLLDAAEPAAAADAPKIHQVVDLDRRLSGLILARMLRIREEALAVRRGSTAMHGYKPLRPSPGLRFNSAS